MRFFGQCALSFRSVLKSVFALSLLSLAASAAMAQSGTAPAPYLLPYTMSTFAGPHAAYTAGAACGNFIALNAAGDGCLASQVSVGLDPHDIRVDGQGNVFWLDDNGSSGVIHRINPVTGRQTIYAGSLSGKICGTAGDKYGDNCPATDGAANLNNTNTAALTKGRGLGLAPNGDLFFADYNGDMVHRIAVSTGFFTAVAGAPASANTSNPPLVGPLGTSLINTARGVGADAYGNVYIADTGDGMIRVTASGNGTIPGLGIANPVAGYTYNLTQYNPSSGANTKVVVNGVPVTSVVLNAPEDVQVDINGNIYIADAGNNLVRAIYGGKGSLPNVTNPQTGYIYVVAGYNAVTGPATATPYPKDGTTPTLPALSVAITDRKISLDNRGNLYIADSSSNVVWFVDATTGNIRLLAGIYVTAGTATTVCAAHTNSVGDGCPATQATMISNADMGVSLDNQGNMFITDAELGVANGARLREVLSGLNFAATTRGTSLTQTLFIHFAAGDKPAALNPFVLSGAGGTVADYAVGTPVCTTQTDTTTDCLVPVTFTPRQPGYDTATITITSLNGATNSYLLQGTGTASAAAIDPGSVTAQNTLVKNPQGVAVDSVGNIYTADTGNNRVLFYNAATGTTTTLAGTGTAGNSGDGGQAALATLRAPRAVTIDTSGAVYIADTGNNTIRRIAPGGIISTIGGAGNTGCTLGSNSRGDGCLANQATFNVPSGLAADNFGVLYVADTGNNVIRTINNNGYVNTFAGGSGSCGSDAYGNNCPALNAVLKAPTGLAFDQTGASIIVADTGNNMVRSISLGTTFAAAAGSTVIYTNSANPTVLVAGTGVANAVTDNGGLATQSNLNGPTGVAVDAARNIYIADTGNSAVRLVTAAGTISTVAGLITAPGTGTVPGSAANAQLTAPAAVAVSQLGTLQIADAGNNRILTDVRSQVTFPFGRTNIGFSSPLQIFSESSIGTVATALPTPLLTPSVTQTQFTLTPVSGSTGCVSGALAVGSNCFLQGQFNPNVVGNASVTYTEVGANTAAGDPAITLTGTGAILTKTTATDAQTSPAGTSSQFGGSPTVTATITAASCNAAAPTCYPTGTVRFIVDNGTPGSPITVTGASPTALSSTASQVLSGLSVGTHTVSCNYSGDNYYAASTCGATTITVTTATTTSLLSVTNNNQPQFTTIALTATVSSPAGQPTGTVTFYANGTSIGTGTLTSVNATTGAANITLQRTFCTSTPSNPCNPYSNSANNGVPVSDNTLLPGTYTLTCTYGGSANFSTSNCSPITFTVLPEVADFTLVPRGCGAGSFAVPGSLLTGRDIPCTGEQFYNGIPLIATADGATADATIFINAANTLSGTLRFSCSGLPQYAVCTFLPTSIATTTSTTTTYPYFTDMTIFTDVQPGNATSSVTTPHLGAANGNTSLAALLGWPLTLLGLAGVIRFRRQTGLKKALNLLAFVLMISGSSLAVTGCGLGGPGAYKAVLTPAGIYPLTVTVTNGTITHSTTVVLKVTSPGIPGQQ